MKAEENNVKKCSQFSFPVNIFKRHSAAPRKFSSPDVASFYLPILGILYQIGADESDIGGLGGRPI
jgi:hypothetical protein